MKIAWKPALFILANLVFVVILALVLLMYQSVYANPGDEMILIFIFPACLGFLVIGISLFVLGKFFPTPLLNKLLPFISIPASIVGAILTRPRSLLFTGMSIAVALMVLAIFTTVTSLRRHRAKATTRVFTDEQRLPTWRGIAVFTGWGALGFGFGTLVGIFPAWALTTVGGRPRLIPFGATAPEPALSTSFPMVIEYAVMGGIAGALIGGIALRSPRKAWQLALAGAVGFGLGSILPHLTELLPVKSGIPYGVVPGAIIGAVGGAALGITLKHWRKALFLALTGAASFALSHEILKSTLFPSGIAYFELGSVLVFPIEATLVGGVLGAVLGYLEKRR